MFPSDKITNQTIEIIIQEHYPDSSINAFEFGYFLYFFRATYVKCIQIIENSPHLEHEFKKFIFQNNIDLEKIKPIILPYFNNQHFSNYDISQLWMTSLPSKLDLEFEKISKNSPLKIIINTCSASLGALTMAVILSGGKATILNNSFELPPLAHGIRELKSVFDQPQPKALPSEKNMPKKPNTNE